MNSHIQINNLTFLQVTLYLYQTGLENIFREKNNKTLLETLAHHRYINLKEYVMNNYQEHLNVPLGEFLYQLKLRKDDFYRKFLNPYGDEIYSKFGIQEFKEVKGLYAFLLNKKIVYIGRTRDTLGKRINFGYGNISPKNCYRDGQATNLSLIHI